MLRDTRDPNRFATGADALEISARLDEERAVLKATAAADAKARADVDEIQKRLKELEDMQNELLLRLDDARAYAETTRTRHAAQIRTVASFSRFFHPIRRVPPELLGIIFEYCIPQFDRTSGLSAKLPPFLTCQPFRLAVVCRSWRIASLASARAWSSLHVSFDTVKPDKLDNWAEMIKCGITRSSNALIDLYITREKYNESVADRMAAIAGRVAECMSRCRTLRISIDDVHPSDFIEPILIAAAPHLDEVWMRMAKKRRLPPHLDERAFGGADSLKLLKCSAGVISGIPRSTSVERLDIEGMIVSDQHDDLASAHARFSNVKQLGLFSPYISNAAPPPTQFVFPEAHFLRVRGFGNVQNPTILADSISLPKLRSVFVDASPPTFDCIIFARALVRRHSPMFLHIMKVDMRNIADVVEVIQATSALITLKILQTTFSRAGLRCFCAGLIAKNADNEWYNRSLTRVELNGCSFDDCDEADIISCVRILVKGSKTLDAATANARQKFVAFNVPEWDVDTRPRLVAAIRDIIAGR